MADAPRLRTLQLVTTPRPFFSQQIRVLERDGISCAVLEVPGPRGRRSVGEYVRFQIRVLRRTIGTTFDLVHANYGLTAPAAVGQPRRPVVLTLWGSDLFGRYGWVSDSFAPLCDAVIVMSEEMARRLDRECHVISHGIDLDLFRPRSGGRAKAELGWDPDAKHVLFPYDPSREVKDFPRAESIVDGAADGLDATVRLHAVYGVSHDRMPVYMNAADALLLTSTHEGSPNSVKEALACNLPVVSTDVGDVADLLADVRNCAVHDADDELVAALVDVLRSERGTDGRERAEQFGLERMGRDIQAVYDDVLDTARVR